MGSYIINLSCPVDGQEMMNTVFRRINAPGAEAQNIPLPLLDLNETDYVIPWIP